MSQLVSHKRHRVETTEAVDSDIFYTSEDVLLILRRSQAARNHLQDLLERSDQKAGFVVTGIAFLGLFVQQGNFTPWLSLLALASYGLAFICVCITALPRKWDWYRPVRADTLFERHREHSIEEEARESCYQESDLRQIYRQKNGFLFVGFTLVIVGMAATLMAVFIKYL
jgi:hypothetical protein